MCGGFISFPRLFTRPCDLPLLMGPLKFLIQGQIFSGGRLKSTGTGNWLVIVQGMAIATWVWHVISSFTSQIVSDCKLVVTWKMQNRMATNMLNHF